jgi:hypothetical protein
MGFWIASDVVTAILISNHFTEAGQTLEGLGFLKRVGLAIALAAQSLLATKFQYSFAAILGVCLGLSEPKVGDKINVD